MATRKTRNELDRRSVAWPEGRGSNPTRSDDFNREQQSRTDVIKKRAPKDEEEDFNEDEPTQEDDYGQASTYPQNPTTSLPSTTVNIAKDAKDIAKNTPQAIWLFSIHGWIWISFQIPLVLISLAALGVAAGLSATWLGRRVQEVGAAAGAVASVVGVNLSFMAPTSIFMALHFIIVGFAFIGLFITVGYYMFSLQKPFFGKRALLKCGVFMLALCGYAVPLANLFPWIFLYILVMWRYPK